MMKNIITIISVTFLFSCASSNHVSSNKVQTKNNKSDISLVDNSKLICKKYKNTGSRVNTRTCNTKEQQLRERSESKNALWNATNLQKSIIPGRSNI